MMKYVWRQIESWLEKNAPEILETLAKPATKAEIEAAEKQLRCPLPAAVKDSYLIHNGTKNNVIFDDWELLSLKDAVDSWKFLKGLEKQGIFDVSGTPDSDFVKPVWWHERWIPIFYDGCGNHLCLDLAPKRGGRRGQIVRYYHDTDQRRLIAGSLESYLQSFTEQLAADRYYINKYGNLTLKNAE